MDYHFNSPSQLPPVDTDLLILVEGVENPIRVKRTAYIQTKDDIMEYVTPKGRKLYGRFPWTYP